MATKNVRLTAEQERLVDHLLEFGHFETVSEVIAAALHIVELKAGANADIGAHLTSSLNQMMRGEHAAGTGNDALRRALAAAQKQAK